MGIRGDFERRFARETKLDEVTVRRKWEESVVARRRTMNPPDVASLVAPLLKPGERVESFDRHRPDRVTVTIVEQLGPEVAAIVEKFGLGGSGRDLEFAYKSGRWVLIDEGSWRS